MKVRYWFFMPIVIIPWLGCQSGLKAPPRVQTAQTIQSPASVPVTPTAVEPDLSLADQIRQIPYIEKAEVAGMLRAWGAVSGHSKFRMTRPGDFRIPAWVKKEPYWTDVDRATARAYDYGEMNGAYGLIAFIVDKRAPAGRQFSVVVFIQRPGNRYTLHWIYRNADLSRVTLNRHSGDVYLQDFHDDGTTRVCDVQWDRSQKKWACNLT